MSTVSPRRLILASASPRRRELLALMGVRFVVRPADIDESVLPGEPVTDFVCRLAAAKAAAVAATEQQAAVLAADTLVVCEGEVLGKPRDRADALAMLGRLSGRWHRVLSAVSLLADGQRHDALTDTEVCFRTFAPGEAEAYWASGEPADKAGAYGIQGLGGCFVTAIRGSYSGVVGLPMAETLALLRAASIPCGPEASPGA